MQVKSNYNILTILPHVYTGTGLVWTLNTIGKNVEVCQSEQAYNCFEEQTVFPRQLLKDLAKKKLFQQIWDNIWGEYFKTETNGLELCIER